MSWNSGACRSGGRGYWSCPDGLVEIGADEQADEETHGHDVDEDGAR